MAVPVLNLELLGHFTPVFSFLLVLVLVYAALQYTKALGGNKIIHAIIALVLAFVVILIPSMTALIMFAAPWFTILFIMVIFGIIGFKLFGVSDDNISEVMRKHTGLQWTILIVMLVIVIGALSVSFGQKQLDKTTGASGLPSNAFDADYVNSVPSGSTATKDYQTNFQRTLYHPKMLGVLFILIFSAIAVRVMSGKMSPDWPSHDH